MPATDAVQCSNLVSSEYGLRVRLGYREWVTGLDGPARTEMPFTGSAKGGGNDKLFCATSSGIWDVGASTTTPTQSIAFPAQTTDSGFGVSHAMVNSAGHWLLYTDEENGYHVYSETAGTWTKVVAAATVAWVNTTAYVVGDYRSNGGLTYVCTVAGTSAGSGGPSGTSTSITDGTVTWSWVPAISGVDPGNLVSVTVWKNRVWLTERNSHKAWYLDVGAIYGTATAISFGNQFRAGGHLVGLWNLTMDGGAGVDDHLIALSGGGDLVVYVGTDPSSSSTFGLKGAWNVGGVPVGRHVAETTPDGDVLVISSIGLVPVREYTQGATNPATFPTAKVANYFNLLVQRYRTNRGWAIHLHPEENALYVLVPTTEGSATTQLVMSLATRGWSEYADLPIYSAASWGGKLYFGTVSGSVCVNDGYVDGVTLADPTSYTAIQYALLTAFQNLGTPKRKRLQTLRVHLLSGTPQPALSAAARYDFDFSTLSAVTQSLPTSGSAWDVAVWDTDAWGGEYTPTQQVFGATGQGSSVAVALRGAAISRTILVGVDVAFESGGLL